jgi:nitroreductase
VAPQIVDRIMDAARRGPSAGYSQGVEFVVITADATREAIAAPADRMFAKSGHKNFVRQARVHIAICTNPDIYKSRYRESDKMKVRAKVDDDRLWQVPYWHTDAGAAMMIILLAAVSEGIAAAFVGAIQPELKVMLGIPDEYVLIGVALLGHEAPDAREYGDISARPRKRRPQSEVVHRERW